MAAANLAVDPATSLTLNNRFTTEWNEATSVYYSFTRGEGVGVER